jgi:hypothetical protein
MFKNLLVSAWLASPLCGDAPALDSTLTWELSKRMGLKNHGTIGKWTPEAEIVQIPIPLDKRNIGGHEIYCCSNPILSALEAPEWIDHCSRRFDSSKLALAIAPEHRKSVLVASGPYKSKFTPVQVKLVERVCWFVRGERKEIESLLKSVYSLGHRRNVGYGAIWQWTFDEIEEDYSIFAPQDDKQVLMKTIPHGDWLDNVCDYTVSYGSWHPPYWYPAFKTEVAIPL